MTKFTLRVVFFMEVSLVTGFFELSEEIKSQSGFCPTYLKIIRKVGFSKTLVTKNRICYSL